MAQMQAGGMSVNGHVVWIGQRISDQNLLIIQFYWYAKDGYYANLCFWHGMIKIDHKLSGKINQLKE